jgi:hypothetical protein
MTLPTTPNLIFSTFQGPQNPGTNPTLQRAENANVQAIRHPKERTLRHNLCPSDTTTITFYSTKPYI